ncbi:High-affinity nitrate transporter 2.1 [Gonapodya sp. JEL0774]|nr:High-affinity nitrate transporter 2.1 [Gonapodya sp. JEL0774]
MRIPISVDRVSVYLERPVKTLQTDEDGRAMEVNLASFRRIHMRSFWVCTLGFFAAFTGWFATTAILPSIKLDTGISDSSASNSDTANIASNIIFRVMVGPMLDAWGARRVMAALLSVGSMLLMCTAFVTNGVGLITVRAFVGILGAVFVPCQYWTQSLFAYNVVGSANSLSAGWGNLGAGVAYLVTPQIFNLFEYLGVSKGYSWRLTLLVPGLFGVLCATICFVFGDDRPVQVGFDSHALSDSVVMTKVFSESSDKTAVPEPNATGRSALKRARTNVGQEIWSFVKLAVSPPVVILSLMYACSFGVELSVDSKLGGYLSHRTYVLYRDRRTSGNETFFDRNSDFVRDNCDPLTDANKCQFINQSNAGLLGSTFGLLNIFTRAMGGLVSDYAASKTQFPLVGRLLVQLVVLFLNGAALIAFSFIGNLPAAMTVLVLFSIFTEAACGTTFALVPYVDPSRKGAVSGLVGAGGNIGGAVFNAIFTAYLGDPTKAFLIMGVIVVISSLSTFVLSIGGDADSPANSPLPHPSHSNQLNQLNNPIPPPSPDHTMNRFSFPGTPVHYASTETDGSYTSWTPEMEIVLFQALAKYKPIGVHKHFRMLSVSRFFNSNSPVKLPLQALWERFGRYYDVAGLDEVADSDPPSDAEDHPPPPHPAPFLLHTTEFRLPIHDPEWERAREARASTNAAEGGAAEVVDEEVEVKDEDGTGGTAAGSGSGRRRGRRREEGSASQGTVGPLGGSGAVGTGTIASTGAGGATAVSGPTSTRRTRHTKSVDSVAGGAGDEQSGHGLAQLVDYNGEDSAKSDMDVDDAASGVVSGIEGTEDGDDDDDGELVK